MPRLRQPAVAKGGRQMKKKPAPGQQRRAENKQCRENEAETGADRRYARTLKASGRGSRAQLSLKPKGRARSQAHL
jgi:hypothetical protein